MHKRFKNHGFTIVELLVVIVVIGILAAITTVGFNGVTGRAYNVQVQMGVRSYQQTLLAYTVVNSSYPPVPSEETEGADDRICLGTGYPSATCGDSQYVSNEYEPFNTALSEIATLPTVSVESVPMPYYSASPADPVHTFTGAVFIRQDDFTVDGEPNPHYIMFALRGGNTDCGAPVVEQVSNQDPFPSMTPSAQPYSWSDGRNTVCVIALPNV